MNKGKIQETKVEYSVREKIGVLAAYSNGWTKEVNLISWNGGAEKYDIRDWDANHEKMSRGITLREEEVEKLLELLGNRELNLHTMEEQNRSDMETLN